MVKIVAILTTTLLFSATLAYTGTKDTAIDVLKSHDAEVKKLLQGTSDSLTSATRDKIKHHINATFDFVELARLSLGDHWAKLSNGERQHFTKIFSAIIEQRNFDTFLRYYREGEIVYKQEKIAVGKATVTAVAPLKRGEEIEILYYLHLFKGKWRIYDVVIDGASTVEGNRRQYVRHIQKKSYKSLIQTLEKQLTRLVQKKN